MTESNTPGRASLPDDAGPLEPLARRRFELSRLRRLVVAYEQRLRTVEAQNAAKVDFLARMSHELRTPLNAIAGYVDLLLMEVYGPLTEEQRSAIDRVLVGQRLLVSLVTDILSYSRIEAGGIEYHIEEVPLEAAFDEVRAVILPQTQAKRVRFHAVCVDGIRVKADRERLGQILVNLLTNAVKFTPPEGLIEMIGSVDEGGRRVLIDVTDSGPGIARAEMERIFHAFVQLGERGPEEQGLGLGLAICRDLARQMKGDVRVESTPGQGSTFTLVLPRASELAESEVVDEGAAEAAVSGEGPGAAADAHGAGEPTPDAPSTGRVRPRRKSREAASPPA